MQNCECFLLGVHTRMFFILNFQLDTIIRVSWGYGITQIAIVTVTTTIVLLSEITIISWKETPTFTVRSKWTACWTI